MKSIRRDEYQHQQMQSKNGENDFFIHHDILNPGQRASSAHWHQETEEIIYVLRGEITATENEKSLLLEPGDCLCFASNSGHLHFLSNHGDETAEFLVINKRTQSSDIVFSKTE